MVAPPPHYRREKNWKRWLLGLTEGERGKLEYGPSGEMIVRCEYIPATNSLTQRVINQLVVACGMILRVFPKGSIPRKFSPDLVIGTVPALPTAAVTYLVSRFLKAPYIIDLRDAWPDLLQNSRDWNRELGKKSLRQKVLERGPKQLLLRLVERVLWGVYSQADTMLFTSRYLQESTLDSLRSRGLSTPKSMLVRNVFPTPQHDVNMSGDLDGPGTMREFRILYAGTVGRAQNLNNLLEAIAIATRDGVDVKAKILGKGDAFTHLRSVWSGLTDLVEFKRAVEPEKLSDYYAWADCAVVHLAEWGALERAVPSKTYELMENGIFILGAVGGETAALVRELAAGDVVPPGEPAALAEKIKELSKNRHRLGLRNAAQQWVKNERKKVEEEIIPILLEKND